MCDFPRRQLSKQMSRRVPCFRSRDVAHAKHHRRPKPFLLCFVIFWCFPCPRLPPCIRCSMLALRFCSIRCLLVAKMRRSRYPRESRSNYCSQVRQARVKAKRQEGNTPCFFSLTTGGQGPGGRAGQVKTHVVAPPRQGRGRSVEEVIAGLCCGKDPWAPMSTRPSNQLAPLRLTTKTKMTMQWGNRKKSKVARLTA